MADTADASPFSGREIESLVNGCAGSNHALGAGCLLGTDPSTPPSSSSRWLLSALATHWGACSLSNEDFLFLFRYYTSSPTQCPHGPSQTKCGNAGGTWAGKRCILCSGHSLCFPTISKAWHSGSTVFGERVLTRR